MTEPLSTERIIGHYQGDEPGPLVIAVAGLHGNEPAGVRALEQLFDLLLEEPHINPAFSFRGELIGLRGNLAALSTGVRYLEQDMNRIWDPERINELRRELERPFVTSTASAEERELLELLDAIEIAIEEACPTEIVCIDLHTTTADGGIFTITADDLPSLALGAELYAPVVKGLVNGLHDTFLHYFRQYRLGSEVSLRALAFEAGAHDDPISTDRALAAVINMLRGIGCVQSADVRTLHDELLQAYSVKLPKFTELAYVHEIKEEDDFRMLPGYANFSPIKEGEILAEDHRGAIRAPIDGYVLMPLYQNKGEEGFFVVKDYEFSVAY